MSLKINGSTSGSVTLDAPATGSDVSVTLPGSTGTLALTASPTFTGNLVWSGATLRASVAEVATEQTTTSASFTDLATVGPEVTVTTGTKALVTISCYSRNSGASAQNASFAVSGATTVAASDTVGTFGTGTTNIWQSRTYLITGLTAGSNTFTMKYNTGGGTATFGRRHINVIDLGS